LLAQALGAEVKRTPQPEIGWVKVDVDPAAAVSARSWFGSLAQLPVFQWHYDAFAVPAGATRLLTNAFNPNQAYAIADRHIGFQCHIEMTRDMVDLWCRSSPDELPAVSTAAVQSETDIRANLDARIEGLHGVASTVYAHWSQGLRR
jgi:GMP synthase-like glutamine amidotransferase